MTLKDLSVSQKRKLLKVLTCGRRCFVCGDFEDYTGRCRIAKIYKTPEWQDFVKRYPNGSFKDVIRDMEFTDCIKKAGVGIPILHNHEFSACEKCLFFEACLHPEKGKLMTKIERYGA